MKIKTITCHDVYNYGASLQAYALQAYLTQLGHEVEIIDYKPFYFDHYLRLGIMNPRFNKPLIKWLYLAAKLPSRIKLLKKRDAFDDFKAQKMHLTARRYRSNAELKMDIPEADVYICGSDMIWNSNLCNGKDPAFFLEFAPQGKKKIAYAASFAINQIVPEYREKNKQWLQRLEAISVREDVALDILADLGMHGGVHVVDPVFLLNRNSWDQIASTQAYHEDFVLVYDLERNPLIAEMAVAYAEKYHCKIYSLYKNNYANRFFLYVGPNEFINLIRQARAVINNSFHGISFSMIYHREFFVAHRTGQAVNSRMESLLRMVGIEDRFLGFSSEISQKLTQIIDYSKVSQRLQERIERSKEFLKKELKK